MQKDILTAIKELATKSRQAQDAHQAMQFSQAAVNLANAQRVLIDSAQTADELKEMFEDSK